MIKHSKKAVSEQARHLTDTEKCAACEHRYEYHNRFGVFTYRDVPKTVFPYYYTRELSGSRPYLIASKEKALCDQLSTISPIRGIKDYQEYLFDGMRLDEDIFKELDFAKIRRIAPMYHRTNLDQLIRLIDKGRTATWQE